MKRLLLALVPIGLIVTVLAPRTRGDEWNKRTTLTVNEAIQVPGAVLPAGTYVVKLLDSPSDRHIVQIFNAEENEVITTILAIPNYRLKPTGDTVFTFWETPPGNPRALRAWFYPGDNFGQEFAYPKVKAAEIAAIAKTEVPAVDAVKPAELAIAPIEKVKPPPAATVPAPLEIAQFPTVPKLEPTTELPKTASPYPLVGLAGVLSLIAFAVIRTVRAS